MFQFWRQLMTIQLILLVSLYVILIQSHPLWIDVAVFAGNCLLCGLVALTARYRDRARFMARFLVLGCVVWIVIGGFHLGEAELRAGLFRALAEQEETRWVAAIFVEVFVLQFILLRHNLAVQWLGHEVDAHGRARPPGVG
ncbi:MAG: hypothetical protein NXI03_03260 [Alphaproteobacteria bacterium]|uniref:hypothetical protein n=1 Tax=Maricaulis alexandrii TaxID=2570354 RepID=UPI00110803B5|nr:hypothetical protein [Maricaulis alexandrii]MCR9266564.1 hypothetical protein [Alphaproteobacteria bacterium]